MVVRSKGSAAMGGMEYGRATECGSCWKGREGGIYDADGGVARYLPIYFTLTRGFAATTQHNLFSAAAISLPQPHELVPPSRQHPVFHHSSFIPAVLAGPCCPRVIQVSGRHPQSPIPSGPSHDGAARQLVPYWPWLPRRSWSMCDQSGRGCRATAPSTTSCFPMSRSYLRRQVRSSPN